ncbi:MAG: tyrosine-type recombinase/integrase [Bellilinea sp.]
MYLSKAFEGYLLDIGASYAKQTVQLYTMLTRKILEHVGDKELGEVQSADLAQLMTFLRNEYEWEAIDGSMRTLSGSALDNYWKCIRSFFGWAHTNLDNPRPDLNLQRPRYLVPQITSFSKDEIKRLVYSAEWTPEIHPEGRKAYRKHLAMASRNKALVLLLLDTGLRIGEVSRLKLAEVNLETGDIIVAPFGSGQKTKPRMVYLGRAAKKALWHYLAKEDKRPHDPLFSDSSSYLRRIIVLTGERAHVPDCHPHRFRHTFAIEYLRNGGDPFTLQRLLGHSTLEMARRYLNLVEGDSKAVHERASPADHWRL